MRRLCVAMELTRAKRARANMVLSQVAPAGFESAQLVQHARIQILYYTAALRGPAVQIGAQRRRHGPAARLDRESKTLYAILGAQVASGAFRQAVLV
jgi:hypothetical protein